MKKILFLMLFAVFSVGAAPYSQVEDLYGEGVLTMRGASEDQDVLILAHGYGGDRERIAQRVKKHVTNHLVSFDFPDYGKEIDNKDPKETSFGTINELIPLLTVMKKTVIDGAVNKLSLYGFSAGGGAVVNAIAVLNGDRYQAELEEIGITSKERKQILNALEKGVVILDTPLKSVEEIISFRGSTPQFEVFRERYQASGMRPIDSVMQLYGLKLNVFVYFEKKDEALSNRDDHFFIQRLQAANFQGKTFVIVGEEGGHSGDHKSLWEALVRKDMAAAFR